MGPTILVLNVIRAKRNEQVGGKWVVAGGGGGRSAVGIKKNKGMRNEVEVERRMGDVDRKVRVIFQAKFSLFVLMYSIA